MYNLGMPTTTPKRGMVFTHHRVIDPADYHLPAKQARKARMEITRVTKTAVYFRYACGFRALAYIGRDEFIAEYGNELEVQ